VTIVGPFLFGRFLPPALAAARKSSTACEKDRRLDGRCLFSSALIDASFLVKVRWVCEFQRGSRPPPPS